MGIHCEVQSRTIGGGVTKEAGRKKERVSWIVYLRWARLTSAVRKRGGRSESDGRVAVLFQFGLANLSVLKKGELEMYNKIPVIVFVLAVMASVSMCAVTAEAQYAKNGLIAYWTFDKADISGKTAKDVAGNYDGTINGDPQAVEGKIGDALLFNEKTKKGDFVDLGVDINSKLLGDLTVEGWFSFAELRPAGLHELMCAREGGWATAKGLSYHYCNNYNNEGFNMYFRLHREGGPCVADHKDFTPEIGQWYHLVGTYDGSNAKYYVNGENVNTVPCDRGLEESSTSLKIAHSQLFGEKWDYIGAVDEVRIYERALSEAEINQNLAQVSAAVNPGDKLASIWGAIRASR